MLEYDCIISIHTFRQNQKETHELYKQEKGKRIVKNSGAVFVDVPVLAARSRSLPNSGTKAAKITAGVTSYHVTLHRI